MPQQIFTSENASDVRDTLMKSWPNTWKRRSSLMTLKWFVLSGTVKDLHTIVKANLERKEKAVSQKETAHR
jgi:membrane-anchored glycerophosphoryl diester phosphodiesterase (GDPDase)